MGIVGKRVGSVRFDGRELIDLPSNRVARLGLAFCPEERGIFASLSVQENFMLPPQVRPGGLAPEAIFDLFPHIRARLKAQGFTILLVEQNFRFAARIADRHYVMEHGRVVDMIPNAQLAASMDKL